VTIREAVRADIPHLVVMGLHFVRSGDYAGHLDENPDALFDTMLRLIESGDALLLVQGEDKPTGMIGALIFSHPLSHQTFFSELFWWVEPDHRGNGLALLRMAEKWATARGASHSIMISPDERVSRVYETLGYSLLETHYVKEFPE
jgi:GNAT superfamily N-acetyltransferase